MTPDTTPDRDEPPAAADSITREYPAGALVVEWRQGLCAHSGNCVRANARVFNPRRQPWIDTAQGSDDDIRDAIAKCPSGTLRVRG
ncbi:(4Fe-4S)-binding protein [Gemmatimonas sp.]